MPNITPPYPDAGYNETMPPYLLPDNQFSNLENFYYDSGGRLISRPGTEFVASFTSTVHGIGTLPNIGSAVAIQSGTTLYGRSSSLPSYPSFSSIKTGVVSGTRYFAPMNSALYSGCESGASSNDNLKWDPTSSAAVTWPGSPPPLRHICTWNSRMWGVHRTNRTKLYYSKVGDAEDWSTTGVSGAGFIDIGYSEGEDIVGLVAHNEQLYILKERSIWHIVTGNPNTDNSLWRVEIVTSQHGCSSPLGIVPLGNDILFPSSRGIISLNAALYQGDFKLSHISAPIPSIAGGIATYSRLTDQYIGLVSWGTTLDMYAMQRAGQNVVWSKMTFQNASGSKLQPLMVANGFQPQSTYGNFYPGLFIDGMFCLLVVVRPDSSGINYDVLQYPTTTTLGAGHYDYIDGPFGAVPIRKKFRTKMFTFGTCGYDKRTKQVAFSFRKTDKQDESGLGQIDNDEMTFSVFFDGDRTNKIQSVKVLDNNTDLPVYGDHTFNAAGPLQTAVIGVGGVNGFIYKGIQVQLENNIGGYGLEYGQLEMDVENIETKSPRPSVKVLS